MKISIQHETLEYYDKLRIIRREEMVSNCLEKIPIVDGFIMTDGDLVVPECPLCGRGHFHANRGNEIGDHVIDATYCDKTLNFVRKYEVCCIEVVGNMNPKKFRKYANRKPNKKRVVQGHLRYFYAVVKEPDE